MIMKKKLKSKKIWIYFALLAAPSHSYANDGTGEAFTKDMTSTKNIEVPTYNFPGSWIELGNLGISKYSQVDGNHRCSNLTLCGYTAVRVNGGTSGNKGAYYRMKLEASPVTVSSNGINFVFSVYFKGSPYLTWQERNLNNNRNWFHTIYVPVNSIGSSAGSTTNYSQNLDPSGVCGSLSGCTYGATTYFTSGGDAYLALKVPENLAAGTYQFSDVEVLSLWQQSNNATWLNRYEAKATVKISGTIKLPNRCYFSSSQNNINFSDVKINSNNGSLETKDFKLLTTCQGIQVNVKQYLTVSSDVNDYIKVFSYDEKGNKALGFAMQIAQQGLSSKEPDCDARSESLNKFNSEYLIRTIPASSYRAFEDTVKFSLCKFSVPASKYIGAHNIPIKIISRWES